MHFLHTQNEAISNKYIPLLITLLRQPFYEFILDTGMHKLFWIQWTFNFMFFMGMANHKLKIPTTYLSTLHVVILCIIWNLLILMSTNMSISVKPWNFVPKKLNDFTVENFTWVHFSRAGQVCSHHAEFVQVWCGIDGSFVCVRHQHLARLVLVCRLKQHCRYTTGTG